MPQTRADRRYWAERKKRDRLSRKKFMHRPGLDTKTLVATSQEEYADIKRLHPDMPVRLDLPEPVQAQLFNTQGLVDV